MKQSINLIGGGFAHSPSTAGYDNKYVNWLKHNHISPISIYVDVSMQVIPSNKTKNYAWLVESKTIQPHMYHWCESNIDFLKQYYIRVFTHDVELAAKSDIFTLTQCSGKSFIQRGVIYPKSKLVSMIASNKVMCPEHILRQQVVDRYKNEVDLYGRGYREIDNKKNGLADYAFSITMENATYSNMFTEKITDCFMCGTIPIYYGIPNIDEFFNPEGIIQLHSDFSVAELTFNLYSSKLDAVKENYRIAQEMLTAEDYIYVNFLKYEI